VPATQGCEDPLICYNKRMEKGENTRAHLLIAGAVQGVFYRAFTRNVAVKLGLHGWVRNLFDGRVEAVFEGSRELIEQAVRDCRRGPEGSYVSNIDLKWEPYTGTERGFEIRY
jgi:acylphosphatase